MEIVETNVHDSHRGRGDLVAVRLARRLGLRRFRLACHRMGKHFEH